MKICLIAPVPPFRGGIAKYCHSLAQELEKRHELLLLSYSRQYPTFLYGARPQLDLSSDRRGVRSEFQNASFDIDSVRPATWRNAAARIETFAPDVIILPWWVTYWTPLYAWLMRRFRQQGIRCLLLCINVYDHEDSPLKKLLTRYILRRGDLLIVHSEQEREELRKIAPSTPLRKQLLPIFSYPVPPLPRETEPRRTLNLLFFGFVRSYKGLDLLLRAVALVTEFDLHLSVVGEFWDGREEYLRQIRELGITDRVTVVDGYVTDDAMADSFGRADVVVLPYRASKTSGVIATAYGFGRPVLATDVGGFSEVVKDGYTGKLVEASDPRAMADGIRWFCNNREINFTENIASFVAEQMSWEALVKTIEEMVGYSG